MPKTRMGYAVGNTTEFYRVFVFRMVVYFGLLVCDRFEDGRVRISYLLKLCEKSFNLN